MRRQSRPSVIHSIYSVDNRVLWWEEESFWAIPYLTLQAFKIPRCNANKVVVCRHTWKVFPCSICVRPIEPLISPVPFVTWCQFNLFSNVPSKSFLCPHQNDVWPFHSFCLEAQIFFVLTTNNDLANPCRAANCLKQQVRQMGR